MGLHEGGLVEMNRIFISYTTKDSYLDRDRLAEIDHLASRYGFVFIDALHNDSVNRQRRVEQELIEASVVLFIRTSGCSRSEWVGWERHKAVEYGKYCIEVPFDETGAWESNLKDIETALIGMPTNECTRTGISLHSIPAGDGHVGSKMRYNDVK